MECSFFRTRVAALQQKMVFLESQIEEDRDDVTQAKQHHNQELQNQQLVIKALQAENAGEKYLTKYPDIVFQDKQLIIDNYAKQLKEAYDRFEGESAQTQGKLNMAFEIAASLRYFPLWGGFLISQRKLLEQKESYIEQLKSSKDQLEHRLNQIKSRMDESGHTLKSKESQIHELHQQVEENYWINSFFSLVGKISAKFWRIFQSIANQRQTDSQIKSSKYSSLRLNPSGIARDEESEPNKWSFLFSQSYVCWTKEKQRKRWIGG